MATEPKAQSLLSMNVCQEKLSCFFSDLGACSWSRWESSGRGPACAPLVGLLSAGLQGAHPEAEGMAGSRFSWLTFPLLPEGIPLVPMTQLRLAGGVRGLCPLAGG